MLPLNMMGLEKKPFHLLFQRPKNNICFKLPVCNQQISGGLVGLYFGDCTFCPVLFLFFFITDFRWTLNFFHPPFFFWNKKTTWAKFIPNDQHQHPPRSFFRTTLCSILRIPRTENGDPLQSPLWILDVWRFLAMEFFQFYERTPKKRKEKSVVVFWCFANSVPT